MFEDKLSETITATYSPEDNKIRLYPEYRLDDETFKMLKEAGFKWAPKQELFVAPKWSPKREDIAIKLAGEIEPELTTVAERAQAKADRLDDLANKRAQQANAFHKAADELSKAFEFGQPILVGHHSEKKARKTQERMHNNMDKAVKAHSAVEYWQYRASSVERHANLKNDPKVRRNRIKTLLAELRDWQRKINEAHKALAMWDAVKTDEQIRWVIGNMPSVPFGLYSDVQEGKKTPEEAKELAVKLAQSTTNNGQIRRWISHTLNRLSYEREMLGDVPRFDGEITPTLLQMFVREHGADKPKGKKIDEELFAIECEAPLPAHIAIGSTVELSSDEWRDLMQSCGYVPRAKKAAKPPILNFKAESGKIKIRNLYNNLPSFVEQVEMTKAEYAKIHTEARGTRLSACGEFRVRMAPNPYHKGPRYAAGWVAILITDQKQHEAPEGLEEQEAA